MLDPEVNQIREIFKGLPDEEIMFQLAKLSGYERKVPNILQFMDDPYYLGKVLVDSEGRSSVYPIWRKAACELFPTPYTTTAVEVYLTGG